MKNLSDVSESTSCPLHSFSAVSWFPHWAALLHGCCPRSLSPVLAEPRHRYWEERSVCETKEREFGDFYADF